MIDWDFIAPFEGGRRLQGYVPASGSSGVTIAIGVDLGTWQPDTLTGLPDDLRARLAPYVYLKGAEAATALRARPLAVSGPEADLLDAKAQTHITAPLASRFRATTGETFDTLPDAVQTVVTSLAYQYGEIWVRCPKYWQCLTSKDWTGMIAELDNFGDAYSPRREAEAKYLSQHLNGE